MLLGESLWGMWVALGALVLWSVVLTVLFTRQTRHYNKLLGNKNGNLRDILEKIIKDRQDLETHIQKVEDSLGILGKRSIGFIQKMGIVRFSPYQETGGNQSFAISLLDGYNNGVVILSLHGRESTRVYVKPVEKGKSKYELSKEEQSAIDKANAN